MTSIAEQARSVFFGALGRAAAQWPAFLDEKCGANAELRAQVEQLLRAHQAIGSIHVGDDEPGATIDQQVSTPPGSRIGPYKLIEQIGEGGMGTVYMAQQSEPVKRLVALKLINPGMDSRQVIARFEAERQALAVMDHVNIARVLDAGTVGQAFQPDADPTSQAGKPDLRYGRPYFVMELVNGVPITQYCDDNQLTPRQRLELFV